MEHHTQHHASHHEGVNPEGNNESISTVSSPRKKIEVSVPQLTVPQSIIVAGLIIGAAIVFSSGGLSFPLGAAKNGPAALGTAPTGVTPPADSTAPSVPTGPVNVSEDGDPVIGDKNAKVTIIEFSDFQCPFCKRFFDDTYPQIYERYIKTGKAKMVYRDLPLDFHENAQKAAEAGGCAADQGKFWELHDVVFKNQDAIAVPDLKKYATELGLNAGTFNTCLDSGKYAEEVKKDAQDAAAAGATGTPTFFVNGQRIVGAQPFSAFEKLVEAELAK